MHSFDFLEKYSQSHCLQYKTNNNFFFCIPAGSDFSLCVVWAAKISAGVQSIVTKV